jgi:hypothetical protein
MLRFYQATVQMSIVYLGSYIGVRLKMVRAVQRQVAMAEPAVPRGPRPLALAHRAAGWRGCIVLDSLAPFAHGTPTTHRRLSLSTLYLCLCSLCLG